MGRVIIAFLIVSEAYALSRDMCLRLAGQFMARAYWRSWVGEGSIFDEGYFCFLRMLQGHAFSLLVDG